MQEYEEWMKEKAPRRTSDDCHTPADVYEVVANWVSKEYSVPREYMCRPFYPGGDYEHFGYTDKIVVDNPPFSILSQIIEFYFKNNVKFFLFAPSLTSFSSDTYMQCCHIFTGHDIKYSNGVRVATCFLTNLDEGTLARSAPILRSQLAECESQKRKKVTKTTLQHNEFHGAKLNTLSSRGVYFNFMRDGCERITTSANGKKIFGGGFRLKEEAYDGTTLW